MSGRISYLGGIVKDGLILDLDAAKIQSYPRTGTLWNDISGNQNNGTLINGPTFNSGNGGNIVFDGTNDNVNCGNIPTTNSMSISFWIKTTSTGSLNAVIAKDFTGTARSYIALWRGAASGLRKLYFAVFHNSNATLSTFVESPANIIDDGIWHHILVTFTGDTSTNGLKMFLDGSLVSQATAASGTVWNTNANVTIGALSSGIDWNFSGNIAQTLMYNRALTATEVLQNYNATRGRFGL